MGLGLKGGPPLRLEGLWACDCVWLPGSRQAQAHREGEVLSGGGCGSRGRCGGRGQTRSMG